MSPAVHCPVRCPAARALPAALLLALAPSPASAAGGGGGGGLVVVPRPAASRSLSYFRLDARPGRTVRAGSIELLNATRAPMRVHLSAVDGQTLSTLGSSYAQAGTARHGSTLWLSPSSSTITLAARGTASVSVVVRVPRSASPGDYLSGVSIEPLGRRRGHTSSKGVAIATAERYALGVEVRLPGRRTPLIRFTGAQLAREPSGLSFYLMALNPGNVILKGVRGGVRVTSGARTVLARRIEAGTFVSGTSIAYPVPATSEHPAAGTQYLVTAWLRYQGGIARLRTTLTFGRRAAQAQERYGASPPRARRGPGTPWWLPGLLAAAVLYGVATTLLLLERRRRERRGGEAAAAEERATEAPARETTSV